MTSRRGGRPRVERARGQTLVEFAMVMPIVLMVVLGLVDLGRAVYTYNTLAQAARQGARVAIVNQEVGDVRTEAIAHAPTLGLAAGNVDVCFKTATTSQTSCASAADNCPQSSRVIGCLAIVRAQTTFAPMTPIIAMLWSSIPLSSTSIAPIEYVCPVGPSSSCS